MLTAVVSPVNSSVALDKAGALPPTTIPATLGPPDDELYLAVPKLGAVDHEVPSYCAVTEFALGTLGPLPPAPHAAVCVPAPQTCLTEIG